MKLIEALDDLEAWRSSLAGRVGFVPTMGALHEGHLSLVRRARGECAHVAVSIFVNPTQFAANEDFAQYPRGVARDLALLEPEGVDAVFTPSPAVVYPAAFSTWVTEEALSRAWEGASRPGHFRGVATVVLVLLNLVRPARAYFGEKDYQQLRVVERMVRDLHVPTTIVGCPTVREADGLAMSSRNAGLSVEARVAATVLWRALCAGRDACRAGQRDADVLRRSVEAVIRQEPLAEIDYVAVVDPVTLASLDRIGPEGAQCCVAVRVGGVRLIDNFRFSWGD
jgi:pantoate--beta-alanine ligase